MRFLGYGHHFGGPLALVYLFAHQAGRKVVMKYPDILTPTTHGPAIEPPFNGAVLIEDGVDPDFDISCLKLLPVEGCATVEEIVCLGQSKPETNWSQRVALKVYAAGNAGQISKEVWPVGVCAYFTKTVWRGPAGRDRYVWYVIRYEDGFYCDCLWFDYDVDSDDRLPSSRK